MTDDYQVTSLDALRALYKAPVELSLKKVVSQITPNYRRWIEASKFLILSTVGPAGTDCSPRGDNGPVVKIADTSTLLLPDWKGNNRLDCLQNLILDDRVSLLFMIAGCNNVVRVNGRATVSIDPALTGQFDQNGKAPVTVITVKIVELYFQCAKALMRSELWTDRQTAPDVPTAGDFLKEVKQDFDGRTYDLGYAAHAAKNFW